MKVVDIYTKGKISLTRNGPDHFKAVFSDINAENNQ
jgi:hypothetical protein